MSVYPPPLSQVPIFNPNDFTETVTSVIGGSTTPSETYLEFPTAQGAETWTANSGNNELVVGAGSISIGYDLLTEAKGIAFSGQGFGYNDGTTTTNTTWSNLQTKVQAVSALAPAQDATTLNVNDAICIQNGESPTGTNTIIISASAGDNQLLLNDSAGAEGQVLTSGGADGSMTWETPNPIVSTLDYYITTVSPYFQYPPVAPTELFVNTYQYYGWYFINSVALRKISWYFAPDYAMTVADVKGMYMNYFNITTTSNDDLPFMTIYTKPTGSGDIIPGFAHSSATYVANFTPTATTPYCSFMNISGTQPDPFPYGHQLGSMILSPVAPNPRGEYLPTEEVLAVAVGTNSTSPVNQVNFVMNKVGICLAQGNQENILNWQDLASGGGGTTTLEEAITNGSGVATTSFQIQGSTTNYSQMANNGFIVQNVNNGSLEPPIPTTTTSTLSPASLILINSVSGGDTITTTLEVNSLSYRITGNGYEAEYEEDHMRVWDANKGNPRYTTIYPNEITLYNTLDDTQGLIIQRNKFQIGADAGSAGQVIGKDVSGNLAWIAGGGGGSQNLASVLDVSPAGLADEGQNINIPAGDIAQYLGVNSFMSGDALYISANETSTPNEITDYTGFNIEGFSTFRIDTISDPHTQVQTDMTPASTTIKNISGEPSTTATQLLNTQNATSITIQSDSIVSSVSTTNKSAILTADSLDIQDFSSEDRGVFNKHSLEFTHTTSSETDASILLDNTSQVLDMKILDPDTTGKRVFLNCASPSISIIDKSDVVPLKNNVASIFSTNMSVSSLTASAELQTSSLTFQDLPLPSTEITSYNKNYISSSTASFAINNETELNLQNNVGATGTFNTVNMGHFATTSADYCRVNINGRVSLNEVLYVGGEQGGLLAPASSFTIPLDADRNIQYNVALAGTVDPTPVALPVGEVGGKFITIYNAFTNPLLISIAGGVILGTVSGGTPSSITLTSNQTIQFQSAGSNTFVVSYLNNPTTYQPVATLGTALSTITPIEIGTNAGSANTITIGNNTAPSADFPLVNVKGKLSINDALFSGGEGVVSQLGVASYTISQNALRNTNYVLIMSGTVSPTPLNFPTDDTGGKYITIYNTGAQTIRCLCSAVPARNFLGSNSGTGGATDYAIRSNQVVQFLSVGSSGFIVLTQTNPNSNQGTYPFPLQNLTSNQRIFSTTITGASVTGTFTYTPIAFTSAPTVQLTAEDATGNHTMTLRTNTNTGFTYVSSGGALPTTLHIYAVGT
jgi:hypothetical protein